MEISEMYSVMVIGGGAAGYFAAIQCAELNPGIRIGILEQGEKPLIKVGLSGGGRCNLTHAEFDPAELVRAYPRGGEALRGAFSRFQPADTIDWFEKHGVSIKTERDGRVFPASNNSQTIIDSLVGAAEQAGVEFIAHTRVTSVEKVDPEGFEVRTVDGKTYGCLRLLVATGGSAGPMQWIAKLGHKIHTPVPALFSFSIPDPRLDGLAGVSVDPVCVELPGLKKKQIGSVLITHWGLSGPTILKLSSWGARELAVHNYKYELRINWLPEYNPETLLLALNAMKNQSEEKQVGMHPLAGLPLRLWKRLGEYAGIPIETLWNRVSKKDLQHLASEICAGSFHILGKGAFKEEFVTCGGVDLDEVDMKSMQSRLIRGLFFAGEVLDIDGLTGGYNLQSAWTTGWLAGQALCR